MRAEIAATLVLSDINWERVAVLSRVSAFKETKVNDLVVMQQSQLAAVQTSGRKRWNDADVGNRSTKRPCSIVCTSQETPAAKADVCRTPASRPPSVVKSRARGKGDGLGCTMACGEPDPELAVASKLLKLNKSLTRDILALRKQVVDYSFLDDHKNFVHREPLAWYGRHAKLNRLQMLSMLPETPMDDAVIECWAMLLNRLEKEDSGISRMSFFGIHHMEIILEQLRNPEQQSQNIDKLYRLWDLFRQDYETNFSLSADWYFVPIKIEGHYACVCINFTACTVDLLDIKFYPAVDKSDICKAAQLIASHLSDYLESRNDNRGKFIPHFEFR